MFIAYKMKAKIKRDVGVLDAKDSSFAKSAIQEALQALGRSIDPAVDSPRAAQDVGREAVKRQGLDHATAVSLMALGIAGSYIQNKGKSEAGIAAMMNHINNLIADEFGFSHEELWDRRVAVVDENVNAGFLFQQAMQKAFALYVEVGKSDVLQRVVLAVATRNSEVIA